MLLTIIIVSLILLVFIATLIYTIAMHHVILELTLIRVTILKHYIPGSFHFIMTKLSIVDRSIREFICAFTLFISLIEIALINITLWMNFYAFSMWEII